MELEIFPFLGTRSKRAIIRKHGRYGKPYYYTPREDLIHGLHLEFGWEKQWIRDQLAREHQYLKHHPV